MSGSHHANPPDPIVLTPEQVDAWLASNRRLAAMATYAPHDCTADAMPADRIAELTAQVDALNRAREQMAAELREISARLERGV